MTGFPQDASAIELRDALRRGDLSAREATEHFLGRIADRHELGAFIAVTADLALAEADAADARASGLTATERRQLPALHGLPIAHKDILDVAGVPTTRGSAALPHRIPASDDPGVAVLRAAGTISLGKTQVPELGLNAYSENLIAAPARNPLDTDRTPGGSSGGSAGAVAAGLLPIAPGSDGGGSIRIPALACGLIGLKPGLGTVSTDVARGFTDDFGGPRLAVSGPITRTATDAAMLFDAMRGADTSIGGPSDGDPREPSVRAVLQADRLSGLRIGLSAVSPFEAAYPITLSDEAIAAWRTAAIALEARGHRVEQADITYDPRYPEVFADCWTSALSLLDLAEGDEDLLTPLTRAFRERAQARSRAEKREAGSALQAIAAGFREAWDPYDIVLTPGLATVPPRIGAFTELAPDADYRAQCEWTPFTSMVNVAGLPAIAVPILALPSGLSMGVQLIGRAGSETQLLQLAEQLSE